MRKAKLLAALVVATTAGRALAAAPGSTEITCDVDRAQFRSASQGETQVSVQLWSAAVGGVQCAIHAVPLAQVESVRTKRDALGGSAGRTFQRLRLVIGDDGVAAGLCPDARTWIDLHIGGTTLGCDSAGRRRLQSVPYARQSEQTFVMPPGSLISFTGVAAPSGWLLCDGSAVSRTTYGGLFAVLGTTYGAGDGFSTFNLPDLRGRVPVGLGASADVNVLGENDGLAVASRTPVPSVTVPGHNHSIPSHQHYINNLPTGEEYAIGFDPSRRYPKNDYDNYSHRHYVSGFTDLGGGGATGTVTLVPDVHARGYLTTTYIIKY
jgi:hypothetical protein